MTATAGKEEKKEGNIRKEKRHSFVASERIGEMGDVRLNCGEKEGEERKK